MATAFAVAEPRSAAAQGAEVEHVFWSGPGVAGAVERPASMNVNVVEGSTYIALRSVQWNAWGGASATGTADATLWTSGSPSSTVPVTLTMGARASCLGREMYTSVTVALPVADTSAAPPWANAVMPRQEQPPCRAFAVCLKHLTAPCWPIGGCPEDTSVCRFKAWFWQEPGYVTRRHVRSKTINEPPFGLGGHTFFLHITGWGEHTATAQGILAVGRTFAPHCPKQINGEDFSLYCPHWVYPVKWTFRDPIWCPSRTYYAKLTITAFGAGRYYPHSPNQLGGPITQAGYRKALLRDITGPGARRHTVRALVSQGRVPATCHRA